MTWVTLVGVLGACVGLTLALLGLAFSRAPGWRSLRSLHVVGLACGVYCAFDVVATLDHVPAAVRVVSLRVSLAAVAIAIASWWRAVQREFPSPGMTGSARVLVPVNGALAVLVLVPGLLFTDQVRVRRVPWLDVTYFDLLPTAAGEWVVYVLLGSVLWLVPMLLRAHRRGMADAAAHLRWNVLLLLGFINDALAYVGVLNTPYLTALCLVGVMGSMASTTVRRFLESSRALEALSAELERRVEERTRALKEAEAALARSEKLAALGQLAAGIAHEINNPSSAVLGNLDYLRDAVAAGTLPEDALECLDESRGAMKRVATIVRQMLDTGRAASAALKSDALTDVAKAVEEAVAQLRPELPVSVELSVDVAVGLITRGSPRLLEQIVTNLVANAAHAVSAGPKGHGHILVRAADAGADVMLEVCDDGCGMDRQTQQRIFEPFFTTQPVGKGTGLGLSVTAGLVSTLGGSLTVQSAPGQGTAMRLRLPKAAGSTERARPAA